jgi:hypothetical protein
MYVMLNILRASSRSSQESRIVRLRPVVETFAVFGADPRASFERRRAPCRSTVERAAARTFTERSPVGAREHPPPQNQA